MNRRQSFIVKTDDRGARLVTAEGFHWAYFLSVAYAVGYAHQLLDTMVNHGTWLRGTVAVDE